MKDTLILLHGALGSKKQFKALKRGLESSYEVHLMNFEGHGGQESGEDFSIDLFTKNVADYITNKKLDHVSIFGYSMGGYVALNLALKKTVKLKKIYTLATKFNWDLATAEREVKMLNPSIIEEKVPLFAKKLKEEHAPQDWKIVMSKTAKMMLNMARGAKIVDSDFEKINNEVIVGIGSLDTMVRYEESASISNLLPNGKLITLEGVKHPIDSIDTQTLVHFVLSN